MDDILAKAKQFVFPYYESKDLMHDFSHIERILKLAKELSANYQIEYKLLTLGAYFHGIIYQYEDEVVSFLREEGENEENIKNIIVLAWGSQKDREPRTLAAKVLHDAHLLEGGKTFQIVKTLVTGTARGQSLTETLEYLDFHIKSEYKCYLPESQEAFRQKQQFTIEFYEDLMKNLRD